MDIFSPTGWSFFNQMQEVAHYNNPQRSGTVEIHRVTEISEPALGLSDLPYPSDIQLRDFESHDQACHRAT